MRDPEKQDLFGAIDLAEIGTELKRDNHLCVGCGRETIYHDWCDECYGKKPGSSMAGLFCGLSYYWQRFPGHPELLRDLEVVTFACWGNPRTIVTAANYSETLETLIFWRYPTEDGGIECDMSPSGVNWIKEGF